MRSIRLEFNNQRDVQREELFLLTIIERVLSGNINTISYVDMAKFLDLFEMRKSKGVKIQSVHQSIADVIKNKLTKPQPKQNEFSYIIKTVATSPKSNISKPLNFVQETQHKILKRKDNEIKNQEQQTLQLSNEEIEQQLEEIEQKQTIKIDNQNQEQVRYEQSNEIKQQKNDMLISFNDQDQQFTSSIKKVIQDEKQLTEQDARNSKQTTEAPQKQPSTAQSKVQSRLQSKKVSRQNTGQHQNVFDSEKSQQDLKQRLKMLEEEERLELEMMLKKQEQLEQQEQQNKTSSELQKQTSDYKSDIQEQDMLSSDMKLTSIHQHLSQHQQQSKVSIKQFSSDSDLDYLSQQAKRKQEEEQNKNEDLIKVIAKLPSGNSHYLAQDSDQNFNSNSELPNIQLNKQFKSDLELQKQQQEYFASSQGIGQKKKEKEKEPSQTSIMDEDKPMQINIQTCENQQTTIVEEESQECSPHPKGEVPVFESAQQNKKPILKTQQYISIQQPTQPSQFSQMQIKVEDSLHSTRSKANTPSSSTKIKAASRQKSNAIKSKSNFKRTQESSEYNQFTQKSEDESQPESKMTIESSQGERSNRSNNKKGQKQLLKLPGAASIARRKSTQQQSQQSPVDPKKLEQQERERLKQLEYQKQIDRMRLEKELMEQYKIPDSMPLAQKKQIIETLIKELGNVSDQEAKYQIMLYKQRQEQVNNIKQHNSLEFNTDLMLNCYAEMDQLLEHKIKIKSKEEFQKLLYLRFSDQLQTHFPGQAKEFIKDENSPIKKTIQRQSHLDPVQILASIERREGFNQESDLIKLFKQFEFQYGKTVNQCELDYPTVDDIMTPSSPNICGYLPRMNKRKNTKKKDQKLARLSSSEFVLNPRKIQSYRERAQRISQIGRYLISSQ